MKYTNEMNLPEALVSAIVNDTYSKGSADISVTQLIGPPKIRLLKKRHSDEITEDVTDHIWRLLGTNTHEIVERIKHPDALQEERLSVTVKGWKISGQADLYEDGVVTDFKVTSAWSCLNGVKPEWICQLNVYAELFRSAGFTVSKLQIIAFLRDWSKFKTGKDYPKKQVAVLDVPLWGEFQAKTYIRDRVLMHQTAEPLADDDIPECTPEERWDKPTTYAIVKEKNKRAWRVVDSMEEAEKLKAQIKEGSGDTYRIDMRPGEHVRCANYCSCNEFCHFYKSIVPF